MDLDRRRITGPRPRPVGARRSAHAMPVLCGDPRGRPSARDLQPRMMRVMPMADTSKDLWRVLLVSGETTMTLDALDEAFNAGRIDATTLVLEPGAVFWTRL